MSQPTRYGWGPDGSGGTRIVEREDGQFVSHDAYLAQGEALVNVEQSSQQIITDMAIEAQALKAGSLRLEA